MQKISSYTIVNKLINNQFASLEVSKLNNQVYSGYLCYLHKK